MAPFGCQLPRASALQNEDPVQHVVQNARTTTQVYVFVRIGENRYRGIFEVTLDLLS